LKNRFIFEFRNFDPSTTTNIIITLSTIRSLITKALTDAFGIIGSGIQFDILYWNGDKNQSIISNNNNIVDPSKKMEIEEEEENENEDDFFVGIIKVAKE
jgi:hypothetical protein